MDRVQGQPALAVAHLRPDATHTSYTAMVAWMDPDLVRAVWHPGTSQPGHGPWPTPPDLVGAGRTGLLAAFNSAFRLQDSRGGFCADGRTVSRLRPGAASLVVDTQGRISVGAWGSSNAGDRWGGQKERDGLPDMARAPSRYDTTSSRDFIAVYRR